MDDVNGSRKDLTLFEASSVVAGIGVGGGIMAVPYLASLNGMLSIVILTIAAYAVSLTLHLMVADMTTRDGGNRQLVELFGAYLFPGRAGLCLTWIFFVMIAATFVALLAGYIVGCGEILANLLQMPLWLAEMLAYLASSGVVFFGLKAIGMCEKYAIVAIALIILALSIGSWESITVSIPLMKGGVRESLALFGMLMLSFASFFSVPQAVRGLSWNRKLIPWSIAIGIGINLVFTLTITMMAVLVSREVTEVAIIGWGRSVGSWVNAFGSVFVILAILTSYWSVSYALMMILDERLKIGERASWVCATLPSFALALMGVTGFLGFMRITGAAISIGVAVMVVPALRAEKRINPGSPDHAPGWIYGTAAQWIVAVAYLLAAAGSMIPVK